MAKKKNVRTYQRGKTWTYSFETTSVNGKRKPVTKGGFKTEEEAYKAGLLALAEFTNGLKKEAPVTISYGDFITDWLDRVYIHEVKPKSYSTVKVLCKKHIIPGMGNIKLTEVSHIKVKEFLNLKTSEGYAKSTITILRAIITRTLDSAIFDYNYLRDNPAKGVKLPSEAAKRTPHKRVALSKEDQERVLSGLDHSHPSYIAALIGLHCGLRIGEAFALTWDDIDFDNKNINVNKQILVRQGGLAVDNPKYDSCRIISVDNVLIATLRAFKKTQLEQSLKNLDYPKILYYEDLRNPGSLSPFNFIMRKSDGGLYHRSAMGLILRDLKKKLNIDIDFHTFRHTHCTDMITCGAPLKAIQKRMGHRNINVTLNIYTDISDQMESQVTEILNNYLYAKN